jgi:hypothetical protein
VDARNTWWGSATGPFHPSLNSGGLGNKVSDHVLFNPWKLSTSVEEYKSNELISFGRFYPNPASGQVTIPFEIGESGKVLLQVVNADGRITKTLLDENRFPGAHQVEFNSSGLANGTYLLRLSSNNRFKVSRLVVLN